MVLWNSRVRSPPESPSVKRNKKAIDRADKEARSAKKTVSTPKKAAGTDATSPDRTREKSTMDPNMTIKVPDAVREMGARAVEQTEKAFDTFLRAANQSVAAIPSPAADISKKTLAFTEQNMKAAFEYARKLLHAKDMQEVMQIQADFFKSQVSATQEQMRQMVSAVSAAKDVAQDVNKS
jgi:phasin